MIKHTVKTRTVLNRFPFGREGGSWSYLALGALVAALAGACSASGGDPGNSMDPVGDDDGPSGDDGPGPGNGPGVGPGAEPTSPSEIIEEPTGPASPGTDGPPPPGCGDGVASETEACDDGNNTSGDGCVANCSATEDGYICPLDGGECRLADVCGDGRQKLPNENCDDGNLIDGDGCSASCFLEVGWACPVPGMPCENTVMCGDGIAAGNEQCDDLNTTDGDGCSADCTTVEPGWSCLPGAPCNEICGDTLIVGNETCDDGNAVSGDGCEANCILGPGFACDATGCHPTVCGDGIKEGAEPCDDGQDLTAGDGCSPGCRLEPTCNTPDGTCTSTCGDGMVLPGDSEECDDGNNKNSDGCSSDCKMEGGFICELVSDADTGVFELPIIYRDFVGMGWSGKAGEQRADGHPDFENPEYSAQDGDQLDVATDGPGTPGIVGTELGMDGLPVYAQATPYQTNGAERFSEWFRDVPGVNMPVYGVLQLFDDGDGTFVYDNPFFFPIDEAGLVLSGEEDLRLTDWFNGGCWSETAQGDVGDIFTGPGSSMPGADMMPDTHNFSFTSEVRYWFEYKGGEQLVFRGDDDVWVFIKKRLVVDLGGVHIPMGADVCGNVWCDDPDLCDIAVGPDCAGLGAQTTDISGAALGLEEGKVYEAVVFQAERHTCQSNYRLTLSGFAAKRTHCESDCGDGILAGDEACDDGADNGAGYGFCTAECLPGPRCGDGLVDPEHEQCDKGLNVDGYRTAADSCAPGCVLPPYCGDGQFNANFGEECDLGEAANLGAYDGCNPDCTLGPRCGDGVINGEEECDDGNRANNDGCNLVCETERVRIAR